MWLFGLLSLSLCCLPYVVLLSIVFYFLTFSFSPCNPFLPFTFSCCRSKSLHYLPNCKLFGIDNFNNNVNIYILSSHWCINVQLKKYLVPFFTLNFYLPTKMIFPRTFIFLPIPTFLFFSSYRVFLLLSPISI